MIVLHERHNSYDIEIHDDGIFLFSTLVLGSRDMTVKFCDTRTSRSGQGMPCCRGQQNGGHA